MGRKRALVDSSSPPVKRSKPIHTAPKAGEAVLLCWFRLYSPPFSRLSLNITREIASCLPAPILLPAVYKKCLLVYSVSARSFSSVPRPCGLTPKSLFCLVGFRLALAFDTANVTAKVVALDMVTGTMVGFPAMMQARRSPAAIHLKGFVYVFGGWRNEHLTVCERYGFQEKVWSPIVEMPNSRGKTHLSIYNNEIYLLPSSSADAIECFNPRSQTYRIILKSDPALTWKSELSVIIDSSILLFPDDKSVFEYKITTGRGTLRDVKGGKVRKQGYTTLPVVREGRAVWVLAGVEGIGSFDYRKMEGKITHSIVKID